MLDRYWTGPTARISPEAPVPVVHVDKTEERPGGAANVATNMVSLGVRVGLAGVVGEDEAGRILEGLLERQGVRCHFQRSPQVPTITKLRVLSRHQQLLRLDFEKTLPGGALDSDGLAASLLEDADALVISDYAKGTVGNPRQLIAQARQQAVPVLVDPKGPDFSRYRGATLLTPNLAELEAICGPCANDAELMRKGERVRDELSLQALLITLGERGMLLLRAGETPLHLPTRARDVFDVTGAGDTVIAVLAASLAAGAVLTDAAAIANAAAGQVVAKLGTGTVSLPELRGALRGSDRRTVLTRQELLAAVEEARTRGERIVMTNGCFDILHQGHIIYLQQARQLGERLVVAVNDDASVRRLKGEQRPINPIEQRMAVLAGLASVDWVVPFSEDTPEALICALRPDVLVKGGDYRAQDVAGYACVTQTGGEVRILEFVAGHSTSRIIDNIRGS